MQVKIIRMSESKIARYAWSCVFALGLGVLCLPGYSQGPGAQTAKTPDSGPRTATESSPTAGAQQNLYGASGQNGAQATQDSFRGSIVDGKSTGTVIDLSLDDAIQRGLRQNLGIILQSSALKNANGQRLEQLQALLPTVTGSASLPVQPIHLAPDGFQVPRPHPIFRPFPGGRFR